MGIEAGVYARLTSSTALTALVGSRIYPNQVPEGVAHPNVVFTINFDEAVHTLNTTQNLHTASIDVEIFAVNDYLGAINISNAVRKLLNTQSTTFGTISVANSHVSDESDDGAIAPTDGSDDYIYARSVSADLHYYST